MGTHTWRGDSSVNHAYIPEPGEELGVTRLMPEERNGGPEYWCHVGTRDITAIAY